MATNDAFPILILAALILIIGLLLLPSFRQRPRRRPLGSASARRFHSSAPTFDVRVTAIHDWYSLWDSLTFREREVARLAAAGKQNAEIADELHVSPATVAGHLKNVYKKLGIHSRIELANLLRDIKT